MKATDLLTLTPQGLYCPQGDFHIDPQRPVARAVVTHGHADHCRPGQKAMLATSNTIAIAQARYGADAFETVEPLPFGEVRKIGDVEVSLFPAGHVLGLSLIHI